MRQHFRRGNADGRTPGLVIAHGRNYDILAEIADAITKRFG